jgi:hypothetical protein
LDIWSANGSPTEPLLDLLAAIAGMLDPKPTGKDAMDKATVRGAAGSRAPPRSGS